MRTRMLAVVGMVTGATALGAQEIPRTPVAEVRPFVGAYLPTGAMRDNFETATTLGAQLAIELSSNFHVVGSGSWTHGHNTLDLASSRTDIWQYDVGVEANLARPFGDRWLLRPFAGIGAGGRTYDYKDSDVGTKTCTAGYAALGTELQTGPFALRLEGRDYLSCFESPVTGEKSTLNDVGLAFGVAYHIR